MEPDTPNFDSLAHVYRWMEYCSFGPMLERCRFRFLTRCSQAHHALVLGDGDGRFTARLLTSNPTVQVDAVDTSAAMLEVLRGRARSYSDADSRLRTIQADLRRFSPTCKDYDLVASHFFLDCLTDDDASALVERLVPHMTEDAIWLVSEFFIPEKGWWRMGAWVLVRFLYFAFSILTRLRVHRIPDYSKIFRDHGLDRSEDVAYLGGLLVSEVWRRRRS